MAEPPDNINTIDFWKDYLESTWEKNSGREQTRLFSYYFNRVVDLPAGVASLLDVSCAMGDGLAEFNRKYPDLRLFGQDISEYALENARQSYGGIATFKLGSFDQVKGEYDVIYCSNTLEHFTQYEKIAASLLRRCSWLYVQVPYKEYQHGRSLSVTPGEQHVVTFYKSSFNGLVRSREARSIRSWIIHAPGAWGQGPIPLRTKLDAWIHGRPAPVEYRQIIFEIKRHRNAVV